MKKITIGQVLELVNNFKPNTIDEAVKIGWLSDIDELIKEDIIDTHEGAEDFPFNGYDKDTLLTTELLAPARFGKEIYRHYIELQIDIINKEIAKANTEAMLYQSALQELELWWHNHYVPLQKNSMHW